jgi:phenylalanyl-tRNA synthetase beta chain
MYFSHSGRTANIIIRWKEIWTIWEISPKVANNFEIKNRLWYFEINIDKIKEVVYGKTKAKEISSFQENNFDLNFVVWRTVEWSKIQNLIQNTDKDIITKVDLVDIYEDKEKLKDKRSLVFKIYIQSTQTTLDDKVKNELIDKIIKKVEKAGATLR